DFEYDALYRLIEGTGRENQPTAPFWDDVLRDPDPENTDPYTQQYSYDLMGNMLELAHITSNSANSFTREYSHTDKRLDGMEVGSTNHYYTHDACGNQTRENE